MQAEPSGILRVSPEAIDRLGLGGLSPAQRKVASAMWLTHPVVPTEASLIVMGIPIIIKSRAVNTFSTAPPESRMRQCLRGGGVNDAPVDVYCKRPTILEDIPLKK